VTARDRRAVMVGVALVAGIVIAFRGVPTGLQGYDALRTHAMERQATLARARATIAARRALDDSLALLGARVVGLAPKVVAVGSGADGAAELSRIVNSLAGRANLHVVRLEPLPDSSDARLAETVVRLEVEGDVTGITAFLGHLEHGDPVVTVRSWSIQSSEAPAAEAERLRAEFTVVGSYVRKERS